MAANRVAVPMADLKQLEIVTREQGTTTTIELAGEWDLAGARAVRQAMASALTARPECVMLDLSQLAFIDSTGLHATVELAQRAGAENIRLVIIPGPRAVQRVFEITGVAARLPFNDEPAQGSRAARPRTPGMAQRDLAVALSRHTAPGRLPKAARRRTRTRPVGPRFDP